MRDGSRNPVRTVHDVYLLSHSPAQVCGHARGPDGPDGASHAAEDSFPGDSGPHSLPLVIWNDSTSCAGSICGESGPDAEPCVSGQLPLGLPPFRLQVDDFSADAVVSQILYLDALDSTKVGGQPALRAPHLLTWRGQVEWHGESDAQSARRARRTSSCSSTLRAVLSLRAWGSTTPSRCTCQHSPTAASSRELLSHAWSFPRLSDASASLLCADVPMRRQHRLLRSRCVHGGLPPRCWDQGEAHVDAERAHHDPPAAWRRAGCDFAPGCPPGDDPPSVFLFSARAAAHSSSHSTSVPPPAPVLALAGASGQAVDIEIQAKEIMYHKGNLNRILAFHTGQPVEKVRAASKRALPPPRCFSLSGGEEAPRSAPPLPILRHRWTRTPTAIATCRRSRRRSTGSLTSLSGVTTRRSEWLGTPRVRARGAPVLTNENRRARAQCARALWQRGVSAHVKLLPLWFCRLPQDARGVHCLG